ncbi:MAG: hypothetical protein ACYC91_03900 [Solirubrobacteraceae bacterium]
MSEALEVRAEVFKLSRLLAREPEQLGYLAELPSEDVRALREQVTEALFAAHSGALTRLATASKLLPVGLVATMAQKVFGPVLSARIAGLLEPDRAVEMAAKLPVDFLADVAVELDPRRASQVIARIPPPQVAEITRELLLREEHVTMGRFVGHLQTQAVRAAVGEMDDRELLQVAFVLESKDSLSELIALLPAGRLDGIIDAAAGADLWPEAFDLLTNLSDEQQADFAERAARRSDAVLDALVRCARDGSMWDSVLRLTQLMSETSRRRFAALGSIQEPGVLEAIVATAALHPELWDGLLPLAALLPGEGRARVQDLVQRLPGVEDSERTPMLEALRGL